jgi:hypothetical protein
MSSAVAHRTATCWSGATTTRDHRDHAPPCGSGSSLRTSREGPVTCCAFAAAYCCWLAEQVYLQAAPAFHSRKGGLKVKTTIIALAAAALIAAAPGALAQGVASRIPGLPHHVSQQHHRGVYGYAPRHERQARSLKTGDPQAFGYAPDEPRALNRDLDASRQAGGGGGGGSGM